MLHSSNDNDAQGFMGSRAYSRVSFRDDEAYFKASIYIDRANHGQFNTVWGASDRSGPAGWIINRRPLLDGEAQREIAKVFISGFLEATLKGERGYRATFRDYRHALDWLPETIYLTEYSDSSFLPVATFEGRIDPSATTLEGGRIEGANLALWREDDVDLRTPLFFGTRENFAVRLAWNDPGASYTVFLPEGLELDLEGYLTFAFADPDEQTPALDGQEPAGREPGEPLEFTVELFWPDGRGTALPLGAIFTVQPPIKTQLTRFRLFERPSTQTVFQTVTVPLAAFAEAAPDVDVRVPAGIRFRFDRQPSGLVLLDDIGFLGGD